MGKVIMDEMKRFLHPSGVGRNSPHLVIAHQLYAYKIVPEELFCRALRALPKDHLYNLVGYWPNYQAVVFYWVPDFNGKHEPTLYAATRVGYRGRAEEFDYSNKPCVLLNKWAMVAEDYAGFDRQAECARAAVIEQLGLRRGIERGGLMQSLNLFYRPHWDAEVVPALEHYIVTGERIGLLSKLSEK